MTANGQLTAALHLHVFLLPEIRRPALERAIRAWLARRLLGLRGVGGDEPPGPEGDVAHKGDDERDKVEREEVDLRARQEAVEALGELDRTVDGTDLQEAL